MKTAGNTPTPLAAPSEREWLERLTLATERIAAALERAVSVSSWDDEVRASDKLPRTCPKCKSSTRSGYGLAGGGMGSYVSCTKDGCDFFQKHQDAPGECGNAAPGSPWFEGTPGNPAQPAARCAPVCRTENLHTTSDGTELVCALCSSRQKIEALCSPVTPPSPVAAPSPPPSATTSSSAPPPAPSAAPAASMDTSSSPISASAAVEAPPAPAAIGDQLGEAARELEDRRRLAQIFPTLADMGLTTDADDAVNQPLARTIKDMGVGLLTEEEFNVERDRRGFKGRWPTVRELRSFVLEVLAPEIERRSQPTAKQAQEAEASWG